MHMIFCCKLLMRRTRKRGGKSDLTLESSEVVRLVNEANNPSLNDQQQMEKQKELFTHILNSTNIIRNRKFRGQLHEKIDKILASRVTDEELATIVQNVRFRMDEIPESELVGGRRAKRKTRKARKTRKNYRK